MELLDKANLDVETSTKLLAESINSGLGVKATNSDTLRGLELVFKLHKLLDNTNNQQPTYNIQQNAYINNLNQLSDVQLQHELKKLKQRLRVT